MSERKTYPLYKYDPSLAAAVIFCVTFLASATFHSYQMIRKRLWFLIPLVLGGCFEFVGYACRVASAQQPHGQHTLMPYVIQNSYILLAPALFAATIYMTLGRIIRLTDGDQYSIVSSRKLTWFFLAGNVFCFVMQGGGGSMVAISFKDQHSSLVKTGTNIVLVGLILQAIWFVFFVAGAGWFHYRMHIHPNNVVLTSVEIRWQRHLRSLYLLSGLLLVRSIFRLIEYGQGVNGLLMSNEALFYVLDALPMFIFITWTNWEHPGEIELLLRKHEEGQTEQALGDWP